MFEDSLVESSGKLACRNGWATAASFAAQAAIGIVIVLLSLVYTDALPVRTLISAVEAPPPPSAQAPAEAHAKRVVRQTGEFQGGVLVPPREIPTSIAIIHDDLRSGESAPQVGIGVPNGVGSAPNNLISELLKNPHPIAPTIVAPTRVRVSSGVAQGRLLRRVQPQYPPLAKQARIQGTVVLQAVIGKDGSVEQLRVISGHPMLTTAAIEAVKQWQYRPYALNGEPIAVETQINVNFTLSQ